MGFLFPMATYFNLFRLQLKAEVTAFVFECAQFLLNLTDAATITTTPLKSFAQRYETKNIQKQATALTLDCSGT